MRIRLETTIRELQIKISTQRTEFELQINKLKIIIQQHETTILQKNGEILSLNEVVKQKSDVEAQLEEALLREQDNQAARDNVQKELENATDYILELEEKVYKANKTSLELLKQLKDAEVEIETLK